MKAKVLVLCKSSGGVRGRQRGVMSVMPCNNAGLLATCMHLFPGSGSLAVWQPAQGLLLVVRAAPMAGHVNHQQPAEWPSRQQECNQHRVKEVSW